MRKVKRLDTQALPVPNKKERDRDLYDWGSTKNLSDAKKAPRGSSSREVSKKTALKYVNKSLEVNESRKKELGTGKKKAKK